jgi:subtilisin family serine protease
VKKAANKLKKKAQKVFWGRRRAPSERRRRSAENWLKCLENGIQDFWVHTEWHLDVLDMKPGKSRKDGGYHPANSASSVDIYIVDTGVRTSHEDFEDRIAGTHWELENGEVESTQDVQGHGTAMASAALGRGSGSAKKARLVSVQALRASDSSNADIIAGLDWIAEQPCDKCVVSMSLTGGKSTVLNNAVQNLIQLGYPVVVSAGNNGGDACHYSPASVADAITVGSLGKNGDVSTFSNTGTCVDIYGPGEDVRTAARKNCHGDDSDQGTASTTGTSPATALAAGVAAVYLHHGVPKEKLKEAMQSGATTWSQSLFLHATPPSEFAPAPVPSPPVTWETNSGETSSRRRWWSWRRTVEVESSQEGAAGDTLLCKTTAGACKYGDNCDLDLLAKGYYPRVHRRRRRERNWQELGWSISSTLQEELQLELTHSGPVKCEARPSSGHADVQVEVALVAAAAVQPM